MEESGIVNDDTIDLLDNAGMRIVVYKHDGSLGMSENRREVLFVLSSKTSIIVAFRLLIIRLLLS